MRLRSYKKFNVPEERSVYVRMKKYTVDRIENNIAVCFDENDRYAEIPAGKFGFQVREGMILLYDEQKDSYTYDKEATERLLHENGKKLRSLFDRSERSIPEE